MIARKLATPILFLALAGGVATWAVAQPTKPAAPAAPAAAKENDDEVEIKFAEAPEAVRTAALKVTNEKSIKKVIKESDEGVTTYEVEFADNGASGSVTLSGMGDVLEVERGITQDKLPPAAQAALKKSYAGASFGEIHLVTKTFYEVEIVTNGKKHEIKVNAAGDVEDSKHEAEHEKADEGKN